MSAEILRQAAALMRERATDSHVAPGPWDIATVHPETAAESRVLGTYSVVHDGRTIHAYVKGFAAERTAYAQHIASWHPAVALAVADWLDYMAGMWREPASQGVRWGDQDAALAVACAYLGDEVSAA